MNIKLFTNIDNTVNHIKQVYIPNPLIRLSSVSLGKLFPTLRVLFYKPTICDKETSCEAQSPQVSPYLSFFFCSARAHIYPYHAPPPCIPLATSLLFPGYLCFEVRDGLYCFPIFNQGEDALKLDLEAYGFWVKSFYLTLSGDCKSLLPRKAIWYSCPSKACFKCPMSGLRQNSGQLNLIKKVILSIMS